MNATGKNSEGINHMSTILTLTEICELLEIATGVRLDPECARGEALLHHRRELSVLAHSRYAIAASWRDVLDRYMDEQRRAAEEEEKETARRRAMPRFIVDWNGFLTEKGRVDPEYDDRYDIPAPESTGDTEVEAWNRHQDEKSESSLIGLIEARLRREIEKWGRHAPYEFAQIVDLIEGFRD
jgi:hypothetical protein